MLVIRVGRVDWISIVFWVLGFRFGFLMIVVVIMIDLDFFERERELN